MAEATLQARFCELQGLLVHSKEAHEMYDRLSDLPETDQIYTDIADWIVKNFTMKDVANAESSASAKRLRREVDDKLAKERPVSHVNGNETQILPIGASGYYHEEYDDKEEDQASVHELDEVDEKGLNFRR